MDEIRVTESLDEMTIIIKALLNDIAESFISVGFYLKKTEQDELYKQAGYRNIWEYAKDTFGIGRSTASRFMDINTKYSIGGFSPQIDDKWRGYGSSKLTEMLGLPEEIQEAIPTEATVKDIREAKGIIRETEAHYDEQMELCDIAQEEPQETDWMVELAREYFKDGKEAFQKLLDWERKDPDGSDIARELLVILNPTKFKMIRLEYANVMMTEHTIRVMPYRNHGENQEYDYMDFAKGFEKLFLPEYSEDLQMAAGDLYKRVYDEPLYPEAEKIPEKKPKKKAPAPVKTEAPEKSEPKKEPPKEPPKEPAQEVKKEPEEPEEQIPGQTEITKDFPEYCPDNMEVPAEITEEEEIKRAYATRRLYIESIPPKDAYATRRLYIASIPSKDAASYMADTMGKKLRSMQGVSFSVLAKEEFWSEFLDAQVDKDGDEIECVS